MSPPLLLIKSNKKADARQLVIQGMDARSSHTHFDPAWDWVRQCLLGVLIVSWINQLALLTDGLRVRKSTAAGSGADAKHVLYRAALLGYFICKLSTARVPLRPTYGG